MSRTAAKRAAIALAVVLVSCVALEIAARIALGSRFVFGAYAGPPQQICGEYDAELGWKNRPSTRVAIAQSGATYSVTINSRGQRGLEYEFEKPASKLRVVVLGDSTSWGWGVDDRRMWPRLVEGALAGASPRGETIVCYGEDVPVVQGVEIINLAVPGYGTDQELLAFERDGVKYAPDLVLLGLVHNDTQSNRIDFMQGMAKPVYARDESGEWLLRNQPVPLPAAESELGRRRQRRVLSIYSACFKWLEPPVPSPSRIPLERPGVVAKIETYWDDLSDPGGWTYMLLGRLNDAARAADAKLAVFVIPHLVDRYLYDPTTPLPAHDGSQPYETYGTKQLAEAGRALGFATFSVDAALREEVAKGTNLDCGDEHLNVRGNEIVARVVAEFVREQLALRR